MPFIKTKVSCSVSPEQESELKAGIGKVIITTFTDPMMGLSYESEPIMEQLQKEYGDIIESGHNSLCASSADHWSAVFRDGTALSQHLYAGHDFPCDHLRTDSDSIVSCIR